MTDCESILRFKELQQAIEEAHEAMEDATSGARKRLSRMMRKVVAHMKPDLQHAHEETACRIPGIARNATTAFGRRLSKIELPEIAVPEPEIDEEGRPDPLFTTAATNFVTATRKLVADKALEDDEC